MTKELSAEQRTRGNKTRFWAREALSVREGIAMHQLSGQMTKDSETGKRPWGNVTEHCLVETARAEVLGKWIGLPSTIIKKISSQLACCGARWTVRVKWLCE